MITILLADDHDIFRKGLNMLLSSQPNMTVVGQAVNGEQALMLVEQLRPDVAVVDMVMPGMNGLQFTRLVTQRFPQTRVVVLSMHKDESYVLSALQHGAKAYVLKDSSAEDLVQAVHSATAGQLFLSPVLAERAIRFYIEKAPVSTGPEKNVYQGLTAHEHEVMLLSVEGLSAIEIARHLGISTRTVETHRAHLMRKLRVHSLDELQVLIRQTPPGALPGI